MRLRTRAPNGALSEPVELCGDGAPLYEVEVPSSTFYTDLTCGSTGVALKGQPLADPPDMPASSGSGSTVVTHGGLCSVGAPAARGSSTGTTVLALLALGGLLTRAQRARTAS